MEITIKIPGLSGESGKKYKKVMELMQQRNQIDQELDQLLGGGDDGHIKTFSVPEKKSVKRKYTRKKKAETNNVEESSEPGVCGECGRGSYRHNVYCSKKDHRRVKGLVRHECCGSKQERHKVSCPVENADYVKPKRKKPKDSRKGFNWKGDEGLPVAKAVL